LNRSIVYSCTVPFGAAIVLGLFGTCGADLPPPSPTAGQVSAQPQAVRLLSVTNGSGTGDAGAQLPSQTITLFGANSGNVPLESARINVTISGDGSQYVILQDTPNGGCAKRNGAFLQCTLSEDGIASFSVAGIEPHPTAAAVSHVVIQGSLSPVDVHVDEALRPGTTLMFSVAAETLAADPVPFGPNTTRYLACLQELSPPSCSSRIRSSPFQARLSWMGTSARFTSSTLATEFAIAGTTQGVAGVDAWLASAAVDGGTSPCATGSKPTRLTLPLSPTDSSTDVFYVCSTAASGTYTLTGVLVDTSVINPLNVSAVAGVTQTITVSPQPAEIQYQVSPDTPGPYTYAVTLTQRDCKGGVIPFSGLLAYDVSIPSPLGISKPQLAGTQATVVVTAQDAAFHAFFVELPGVDSCLVTVGAPSTTFDGGVH